MINKHKILQVSQITLLLILALSFIILLPFTVYAEHRDDVSPALTKEDIVNIIKPSVVRLGQRVKGTMSIADFTIDLRKLELTPLPKNEKFKIEIEDYITGSGFFVNPDGYIATNAHVASQESIKSRALNEILFFAVIGTMSEYTQAEIDKVGSLDEDKLKEFKEKIYKYLRENSDFDLEYYTVVIDPTSEDKNIRDAIDSGIQAEVVYSNDNFFMDSNDAKDIAIIKIDGKMFPSVSFAPDSALTVGEDIYALGFPGNAQIEAKDFLESTFTSGSIGGERKMGDASVWQVDAKISTGSSGGPLIDKEGEIIGVIGFQTSKSSQSEGDNFAFAVPISSLKESLDEINIKNQEGIYGFSLSEGIALMNQKHCGAAIEKFEEARNFTSFIDVEEYLQSYIDTCNTLIASGQSIDTGWDEFMEWLSNIDLVVWMIIFGGIVVVVVFVMAVIFLKKRLKVEEKELNKLEGFVIKERYQKELGGIKNVTDNASPIAETKPVESNLKKETVTVQNPEVASAKEEKIATSLVASIDPALVKYISEARIANMTDGAIIEELQKAGWPKEDVENALKS